MVLNDSDNDLDGLLEKINISCCFVLEKVLF